MSAIDVFEDGPRGLSRRRLALSGIAAFVVVAAALAAIWAKADGSFDSSVAVTAELHDVGDGLPTDSDVKYKGIIVGSVRGVIPESGGAPNLVDIAIDPDRASGVPNSVTARVVPSNLFAVSSIQLLDNGTAPAIRSGDVIAEDQGQSTVQFQTALSKLRDIVAATARGRDDRTIGLLAAVSEATDRKGDDIARAGAQLDRITRELNSVMTPDGPSTLRSLNRAVRGLRASAPDLLDALHSSIVPMQTVTREAEDLNAFLAAGATTSKRIDTALARNADQLITITTTAAPVADVFARGSSSFSGIVTQIGVISDKWFTEFWPRGQQNAAGKFMFQFTPHRLYTRADCPRYGELEGASCHTAPATVAPPVLEQQAAGMTPGYRAAAMGGNVGSVGSAREQHELAEAFGGPPVTTTLLLGPVARGTDMTVSPAPDSGDAAPQDGGRPR